MSGGGTGAAAWSAWPAWPRRHPWWTVLVAVLAALLVVALLGGFRERANPIAAAAVGEAVDMGPVDLVVHSAELVTTQANGKPFIDGLPRVLVRVTVDNTSDRPAIVSASGDMRAWVDGRRLEVASGHDAVRSYPADLPVDATLPFVLAKGVDASAGLRLTLRQKSYAWNNKLDVGPTWSGGQWTRVVQLPVQGAS